MGKNHASQYANFGSLQHEGMGKNHASQYANFGSLQIFSWTITKNGLE